MKNSTFTFKHLTHLLCVCVCVCVTLYSCQKESKQPHELTNRQSTFDRDGISVPSKLWLSEFQSAIKKLKAGQIVETPYTQFDVLLGVNTLINFASGSVIDSAYLITHIDSFTLPFSSTPSSQLLQVYEKSYGFYKTFYQSRTDQNVFPSQLEVTLIGNNTETSFFRVKSTLALRESCFAQEVLTNPNIPCEGPFLPGIAYFAGGGDAQLDPELSDFYFNPMCNDECGAIPACSIGPTTAFEAVQDAINTNYLTQNAPTPPQGYRFTGFANIDCNVQQITQNVGNCTGQLFMEIGTCLDNEVLNCMYCELYENIGNTIVIPPGKHFVSLNLYTSFCICGNDGICGYNLDTKYYAKICWGTPIFKKIIIPFWDDPTVVDVDAYYE
jgi:hypothetical protein